MTQSMFTEMKMLFFLIKTLSDSEKGLSIDEIAKITSKTNRSAYRYVKLIKDLEFNIFKYEDTALVKRYKITQNETN